MTERLLPRDAVTLSGEILGRGSDFVVYGARLGGRAVVVKAAEAPTDAAVDRLDAQLRREHAALERLRHPGVPESYGLWRMDDGRLALVRARAPGTPLSVVIQRGLVRNRYQGARQWTPATKAIVGAIGDALAHVHRRGLVHNDVKPDNVLVAKRDDGALTATLLDFGVAGHDCPGGTVHYAAPERLEGAPATVRSDVFSLGVLIYEALTGTRPFPSATIADALLEREIPVERSLRESSQRGWRSLPEPVQAALSKALSHDPRRRQRDVRRLLKELDVAAPSLSKASRPAARPTLPAAASGRRPWGLLVAAALATAAVLTFAALTGVGAGPAAVAAEPPTLAERACLTAMGQRADRICARADADPGARVRCAAALTALAEPQQCEARMRQLATCPADRLGVAP